MTQDHMTSGKCSSNCLKLELLVFVSKHYFTTLLNLIFFCHLLGVALIRGCSQGTRFSTLDSAPVCLRRLLDQSVLFFLEDLYLH